MYYLFLCLYDYFPLVISNAVTKPQEVLKKMFMACKSVHHHSSVQVRSREVTLPFHAGLSQPLWGRGCLERRWPTRPAEGTPCWSAGGFLPAERRPFNPYLEIWREQERQASDQLKTWG